MNAVVVGIGSELEHCHCYHDFQVFPIFENLEAGVGLGSAVLGGLLPLLFFDLFQGELKLLPDFYHRFLALTVDDGDLPHGLHCSFQIFLLFYEEIGAFHEIERDEKDEDDVGEKLDEDKIVGPIIEPEIEAGDADLRQGPK